MDWGKVEQVFAKMCKGYVVTDFDMQVKDIDVITGMGNTVSIKAQNDCYKYNSVLFEVELHSTHTSSPPIEGSLHKCEAEYYVVYMTDVGAWLLFDTVLLKQYLKDTPHHTRTTTPITEAYNRRQGRVYDRGVNITIPPAALLESDALIKVINYRVAV